MELLSVNDIKTNNPYLRMGTDVSSLEESIKTIGLIAPLIVNEKNILLAGGRRFQALMNIGQTEIPVIRYTKGELEQELLSIDENLVRKDLNSMEMEAHLRRAKELYEGLNPDFPILDEEEMKASMNANKESDSTTEEDHNDDGESSLSADKTVYPGEKFLQDLSERTGLKPRQIVQAIKRDEKAGKILKNLRSNGEMNVSQTNELIKLSEDEQDAIIPLIRDKTVAEIRSVVKEVKKSGLDRGIEKSRELTPMTKEITQLIGFVKKSRVLAERVGLENLELNAKLKTKLNDEIHAFNKVIEEVLGKVATEENDDYASVSMASHMNATDTLEESSVQ
tara:strand:- start:39970 stop:40980 length:1011 start_codon:yes stop_codon:yes gene_type:complete